jgi:hypothetical protein
MGCKVNQNKIRITLYSLWVSSWLLCTLLIAISPWIRSDHAINSGQIINSLLGISGIWIPPLTCLATFWFSNEERKKAKNSDVTNQKIFAAITLTIVYLLFVIFFLIWPTYFIEYPIEAIELPVGESYNEKLNDSIKLCLLISPLALAPLRWLTDSYNS